MHIQCKHMENVYNNIVSGSNILAYLNVSFGGQ